MNLQVKVVFTALTARSSEMGNYKNSPPRFWLREADDHYEYSRSREHVDALRNMPNRVIEAVIQELQVELNERDPDFEGKMK